MSEAIGTPEYWDHRVKTASDKMTMIMRDNRLFEYTEKVNEVLSAWKDKSAIDVCCGYGRYSPHFEKYLGLDFSLEMITLARQEYPGKHFEQVDIKTYLPPASNLIFEVNSLHCLGMTPEDFYKLFGKHASIIACLEMDKFTIFQNYGR